MAEKGFHGYDLMGLVRPNFRFRGMWSLSFSKKAQPCASGLVDNDFRHDAGLFRLDTYEIILSIYICGWFVGLVRSWQGFGGGFLEGLRVSWGWDGRDLVVGFLEWVYVPAVGL